MIYDTAAYAVPLTACGEKKIFYLEASAANAFPFCHRTAQKKEIIKAYRKLALQWHPDNFMDPVEKKKAENKFIDIARAKEVLTDPGKGQACDRLPTLRMDRCHDATLCCVMTTAS